jgi:hypothetical protein
MSTSLDESPPPVAKGTEEISSSPMHDHGVRGHAVIVVAFASVVVMACSVWVAWTIAESPAGEDQAGRWGAPNADVQAIEMSLLPRSDSAGEQRSAPADAATEPRRSQSEARQRLSSYGHSDRRRGTVHIPLDRAKQLYLERERARAVPAPRRAK